MSNNPSNPVFHAGNTAVITGGASGIGLSLAQKCAGYGMKVIIADNNAANLAAAKKSIKGNVETVEIDVSKVEEFEKLKGKVEKDFGGTSCICFFCVLGEEEDAGVRDDGETNE
jgi:NAD(P)-dependent dehydrogenase (short-subunit alcohol dehydrogenase family)